MLIMALLVLSIGFLQNIMDLLVDVLNPFNEFGGLVGLRLSMGIFFLCGCKGQCYINGAQWLKSQAHLKRVVVELSYGGICCSFVGHKEGSHPMCGFLELYMRKICMIILLMTYVCPSV
jgi:hypothetical protein